VRVGLVLIFKRWVFWILIGLGLLNFLFHFAFIYLKATLSVQNENIAKFLDGYKVTGTGQAYADFMFAQASICALLLAFAGSTLIGSDYRQGGMIFYLSRRIGRWHYIVGKLLTIASVVTIVTTLPALILYIEYGTLSNSFRYFIDNPNVLRGILGYGLVLAVVQSLMIFAIAAWVPRTVPLVMTWLGIFVLLKGLADAMRAIDGNRYWLLLGFWDDMHRIGRWCFGSLDETRIPTAGYCLAVLTAVCLVSLILIVRRVRAVEVVS
jgi:ABC-type transport system involved in multi-copper enzyme maturation permease subunit